MWARAVLATAFLALGLAGPAAAGRYTPSVAFDGTNYLVVWQDQRPGASTDISAARVSEAGVVLDPLGIPISKASGNQWAPAVAFDGTSFLVVWQDDRSTATGPDLYGGRVSSAGVLLDPGGIPISTAPGAQLMPAVARTGASSLVVWTEGGAGSDIRGARVSPAGAVLDPSGLAVSTASGAQLNPAVAFGSSSSLVVWDDYRAGRADLYGARVTEAGALLDPAGIAIASGADSQWNGAAAFDGASFLVGWDSYAAGLGSDVQARRVSTSGTVLGSGPVAVAAVPGSQARPALAFDGANYLFAWQDDRESVFDIHGVRVSPAGVVLSPVAPISAAPQAQLGAAVARGTAGSLVVWEDRRVGPGYSDIVGSRVTPSGAVLDAAGIPIPTARDLLAPQTRITRGPRGRQTARAATFRFRSSETGSTFQCRLDRGPWRACRSPRTYRGLELRTHAFQVRGRDRSGNLDRSPARRRWRVDDPIPGLLHVVGGNSRRSGPGPLRRYTVQIEDGIQVDRRQVADTIARILGDRRGWGGTGRLSFQRVSSGPVSFRVVLVSPSTVNRLCAPLITGGIYSCGMYGRAVLNLMRWRHGAPAFHGDMTKYRRYLVNHEVGHVLGHAHTSCHAAGARAPVMMQQTKGVGSCRANGWPLAWERG
jgi:Protein of unknown function (DUF3152)